MELDDHYDARLQGVLRDARGLIDASGRADVERLVHHNEGPEAMLLLAELLAQSSGAVPVELRQRIKHLGWDDGPEWSEGF
jgi:hypothetical protein